LEARFAKERLAEENRAPPAIPANRMSRRAESKRPPGAADPDEPSAVGDAAPRRLAAGLYLVSTPIGHVRDITLRALDVLAGADALAAEDTRRMRRLLGSHGIALGRRPLVSYHDRNGPARRPLILRWLDEGRSVAYASDAGTPLVADPGHRLASAAREAGHPVTAVPGASALLAALTVSGLPTNRFLFAGFLPARQAARRAALAEIRDVPATIVFYESPRRAAAALGDMAAVLGGGREAALARELTKTFEEVRRMPLAELAARTAETPPLGEVVLLVGPPDPSDSAARAESRLDDALRDALSSASLSEAVRRVANDLSLPRRQVYARALALSGSEDRA